MAKYGQASTINLAPTAKQLRRIARQCQQLGITEPLEEKVVDRREARNLIFELRARIITKSKGGK